MLWMIVPDWCLNRLIAAGLLSVSWVMILCCRHGDHWGWFGSLIGSVNGVVRMIEVLMHVWYWWVCSVIFKVSLCVWKCDLQVTGGAIGVFLPLQLLHQLYSWRFFLVIPMLVFLVDFLTILCSVWLYQQVVYQQFLLCNHMIGTLEWCRILVGMWCHCRLNSSLSPWYTCGNINSDILLVWCTMHQFLLAPWYAGLQVFMHKCFANWWCPWLGIEVVFSM